MAGTKQHWTTYLLYTVAVLFLAYSVKIALKPSDFTVFLEAASLVSEGTSPYDEWIFVSEGNYCLYFYSPLWAVLLIPFSYLPAFIPQFFWLCLNLFFLYRIWHLLAQYVSLDLLSSGARRLLLALTIVATGRFILYNFEMIQMTIFLLWGGLESLRLIREDKLWLGSALLALVINVKILPIVLVPYLLYRGQFKGALFTVLFALVYLIVPAIFLGWDENRMLHTDWWGAINPANAEHLIEADLGPHSLTALVPTLLTPTEGILPQSRHFLELTAEQAILALNIIRVILVLLTLYFLSWPPFKKAKSRMDDLYSISYLFLLIPLIFPHQQKYAFLCCLPSLFYLLYYVLTRAENRNPKWFFIVILMALSFTGLTLTTDGLVGRELNELFQHYKVMTYGAILLIPALMIARPTKTGLASL